MSRNYRAPWHDYKSKCCYHITLMKNPQMPVLGYLAGDCDIPVGSAGSSYIKATALGQAVKAALRGISSIDSALKVYQYALMPDHLHVLLGVESELDEILGRKIGLFKNAVNKLANCNEVFSPGFHDAIVNPSREFSTIINYIRSNPYRLAVRFRHPDYFRRVNDVDIAGRCCQAYGNMHLLDNPFKLQVVCHRSDSEETRASNYDHWMHAAANGGVLVSPFISPVEKGIRAKAEELGARIIVIGNRRMSDRVKPAAHDFELCEQGRLLTLVPLDVDEQLTRSCCLSMNRLASDLTSDK